MKNETIRTKTQTGFSSRAIALVLCFVMLLTAIGSGSVLSAIAVAAEGSGAAELVDAAKAGADVNAPVPGEAEESSDVLEPEDIDDGFALTKKGDSDIADTGRDADIAETGTNDPTAFGVRGGYDTSWTYHAFTRYHDTQLGYYTATNTSSVGLKITNGNTWDNDKTYSMDNYTLGEGYANNSQIYTGNNDMTDSKTGTHYVCFVNDSDSNKFTWYETTIPTSNESTIYIRNTNNATNIRLYIYDPQLYDWSNSPYILQNGTVKSGGTNGWTVTELTETGGTTVYKVEGVYNGKIIIRYGDNKTADGITVTNGASYDADKDNVNKNTSYTPPAALVNPKTATAIKSGKRNDGTDRKMSGDGTVAINGGTANSSTATATVESGSTVTFTAAANSDSDFNGWYSDEACTTLLTKNTTYTVASMTSDTTVYASFSKKCYLVGKFYLAELAKEVTPAYNDTTYGFTQSSSNPALYTYENDFMFRLSSGEGTYHLQYVTVGHGGSTAYNTASGDAASGTAASGTSNDSNSNKWTCDTGASYTNCYKHVVFTWNAINETLSWTITDIDLTQYTVMYINCGDWHFDHLWLDGGVVLTDGYYIDLIGIPYETIGSKAYNILLVKNTTIGNKELKYQLKKEDNSTTESLGGVFAGGAYTIDTDSSNWNASFGAPTAATVYYLTGWLNGSDVTTRIADNKFSASGTTWTLQFNSTIDTFYPTVYDNTGVAYHPSTHKSGSGTAGSVTNSNPGADNKWMVTGAKNKTVTFTWNSSNKVLSWSVAAGEMITVYAKDGAAPIDWDHKDQGGATTTSGTDYNFGVIATTAASSDGVTFASVDCGKNGATSGSQYQTGAVEVGKNITITTTISSTDRSKYYVRGWNINGYT